MDSSRPTLLIPAFHPNLDVIHYGWLGGVIFVQNLARLLSDLGDQERPRILVLTDAKTDSEFVRIMVACRAVEGIFRPDGEPVAVKPELHDLVGDGSDKTDITRITALFEQAETLFPACQALFHPYKALHWIPDLQHKHLPHIFDAEELGHRDREFAKMLHERRFVLVSSHATAADIVRYYPNAPAKVYVWPFVSGLVADQPPDADPRVAFGLPEKYLFAPNQFWVHKDHATLFKAIKLAADQGLDIPVVCTGSRGDARKPTHFAELMTFVEQNGLNRLVRYLGVVDHMTLLGLFRHAAAIVQPSLFEGWSTVVEDAKSIGRPIFLTDLSVHHEQAVTPNPFYFFKRGNPQHLASQLAEHWPRLTPGPDFEAEMAGSMVRVARARTSARAFLGIMRDMGEITRSETKPA